MKRRTFSSQITFLVFASIALFAIPFAAGSSPKPLIAKGTIVGHVLLSPICPVERIPPDPACAPKPYKTTINILKASNSGLYKKIDSNTLGKFALTLPAGSYLIRASGGHVYPRCSDVKVKVISKKSVTLNIDCDTGIR